MNSEQAYTEKLFSYGTLQYEAVQLATFGRKLQGQKDTLIGFNLGTVSITNSAAVATSGEADHPIVFFTGNPLNKVAGVVFDISLEELKQADFYESAEYKRIAVQLSSGTSAWVYVRS